jgi:hypothetical protein
MGGASAYAHFHWAMFVPFFGLLFLVYFFWSTFFGLLFLVYFCCLVGRSHPVAAGLL